MVEIEIEHCRFDDNLPFLVFDGNVEPNIGNELISKLIKTDLTKRTTFYQNWWVMNDGASMNLIQNYK